jgi:hypothetical protein
MSDGKPDEGMEKLSIEWADARRPLALFDRSRRLPGMTEDDGGRAERPYR